MIRGRLQVEHIVRLLTEFKNHRRVVELAASVRSDEFASRCVAAEKKDVESVGLGDELLL